MCCMSAKCKENYNESAVYLYSPLLGNLLHMTFNGKERMIKLKTKKCKRHWKLNVGLFNYF